MKHFTAATSKHRPAFSEQDVTPFAVMQDQVYQKSAEEKEVVNPVFETYCHEAEGFYLKQNEESEERMLYERAMKEYHTFREVAALEKHIMKLNRVGVDKNLKGIIEQTARHCGLQMPKTWVPSENKVDSK